MSDKLCPMKFAGAREVDMDYNECLCEKEKCMWFGGSNCVCRILDLTNREG